MNEKDKNPLYVRCGGDFEYHYKLAAYKDVDGSIIIETKDGKKVRLVMP
jgi:hypothetical protein